MKYASFTIINYKGIKNLSLDLSISPDIKIYTLIGLNESGKSTILEAINDFEFEVPIGKRHLLLPKSGAGGFTGDIEIAAVLKFSDDDKKKIFDFLEGFKYKNISIDDELKIRRVYKFENSEPVSTERTYWYFAKHRKTKKSKPTSLAAEHSRELYNFVYTKLFPDIIFYKDFLSAFPEKIYLKPTDSKEEEYYKIIEDILSSISPSYNVNTSLLERIVDSTPAKKQALEIVEGQISAEISKRVFDAWSKLQKVNKKEIIAKTGQDEMGRPFIRLSIKEGHTPYEISEKSLGFRWFFTFLLYTEFRKERNKKTGEILFLLDEPASNLHQAAQKSLLDTFKTIVSKSRLVYTTHSHHLINPEWLSSAYIIKNKGLHENEDSFNSRQTEIEAYKYKQFVSSYPGEKSYFQPILDVLDYEPGLLEMIPNIIITEGKNDYIALKFFKELGLEREGNFSFYPGRSASSLDMPISLYESWGRNYLVLLDDDQEGRKQKKRYIEQYGDGRIFTLADISADFTKCTLENLFTGKELISICQEFNTSAKEFEKSTFHAGVLTLINDKNFPSYISKQTLKKFEQIINFCESKLNSIKN